MKYTVLKETHEKMGAKMVEFAGWYMPIQYEGLKQEHLNVRENVGLFDVSHMGEIRVRGDKALSTLQWLTTNDIAALENGQAQYSLFPNAQGTGLVDDLIVYCIDKHKDYLLCVNAANKDKDLQWLLENNQGADITDESDQWAQIAVQGPKACELLTRVLGAKFNHIQSFHFENFDYNSETLIVAKTGYTGEDGAEVFLPNSVAVAFWQELVEKGQDLSVKPVGLGARDTLRTEMKYSLYGHEIGEDTNPYEAGLGWVCKPMKKDFLGKDNIVKVKEEGLKSKLVGFQMVDRGIARADYELFSFDNKPVGRVTSGTPSPSLGINIGIGFVDIDYSAIGTEILVEIRNKKVKAKVVKTPFLQKS
ncbi:MAG: glycine cleavage system aminomethyltransferase GcvT [Bdellovibrionaceae bacterium]|jgi:aminomethyltransferase|nr:glycine cleavage system aminomethyltransferase GcvT [Pseudobdellovibrionaceae bacterium]